MTRQLMTSTQTAYVLSLNIICEDDAGLHFAVVPLLSFTWFIMAIWTTRQSWSRFRFWLSGLAADINQRAAVAGKLAGIGFNSFVWGVL